MLALVMPLSLMSGDSWEDSCALLAKNYTDVVLVCCSMLGHLFLALAPQCGVRNPAISAQEQP